jgi:hypothetical protein
MSEHTGTHRISEHNEGTRVGTAYDPAHDVPALGAREAFIVAYDRLRGLASIVKRPAVLVAAVDGLARVVEAVVVEAGHSLVIGRHTQCGLRLLDETVALRQLVAHAQATSTASAPIIRLWDLNTHEPFTTEDGQPNAAVIAEGTLYVAVGQYALLFVPTRGAAEPAWHRRAEEAWAAIPPRQFIDKRNPKEVRGRLSKRVRSDGQDFYTPITRVNPLMLLEEGADPEDAWGELELKREQGLVRHRFSADNLERGVLVGRYERCGIALEELGNVSRVHLILVRLGEHVLAIDTASSNGTWRDGKEVETVILDELDSLKLADEIRVLWRRLSDDE